MKCRHLTPKEYTTSTWSGGTTTQLLIWPENGDYGRREFQVRISSATVELEESDFTPLYGVERYITPLSGGFTLTHPGKMPISMAPLETPYRFSGEESTHCVGKATDFNLMLKGVAGEMTLARGYFPVKKGLNAFYAPQPLEIGVEGKLYRLRAGDMLVLFARECGQIDLGAGSALACFAEITDI